MYLPLIISGISINTSIAFVLVILVIGFLIIGSSPGKIHWYH